MISAKTLKAIEYDKVLSSVSDYAVLLRTKENIKSFSPLTSLKEIEFLLKKTQESYNLLYKHNVSGVYFFDDVSEELDRAEKGGTLNNAELLRVSQNLKGVRILKNAITIVNDDSIVYIKDIANRLVENNLLDDEITTKIISVDVVSDTASKELYSIRKNIRNLNAKIRERLNSYIHGGLNKFLQDAVVTIRNDRYVIPVKSEYRSMVKGFIHDQSSSGATVFIEPEQVMELNNDLKRALLDEQEEIHKILADLSTKVSSFASAIRFNHDNVVEIDESFAKAQYAFKNKCTMPILNDTGYCNIIKGRHPLIDKNKVVPVSVSFGQGYNFLLITGPNTGGKTVTLKLVGLLTAMAMSGMFIPAYDESCISIFSNIFCDIGDEQSIEQNLSTFSSHVKNLINILDNASQKSLVLIDEIGAGTDPEEGSALALAIIKKLLNLDCFGIITTHYSRLKEFAMESGKIENASMEFDSKSLKPLYKLLIGIPGSSNAINIAKTLGISSDVIEDALGFISNKQLSFDLVLKKAEESRLEAENLSNQLEQIKLERENQLEQIKLEREKISKEREKIYLNAKQETKRIVADKLSEAEEIIDELKRILKVTQTESKELFRASELKNRLKNSKYLTADDEELPLELIKPSHNQLVVGNKVFVKSLSTYGTILSVKHQKNEAEVLIGSIKTVVKLNDLFNSEKVIQNKKVIVTNTTLRTNVTTDINVIGKDSIEALDEVISFIYNSVANGLEEIKIIHGVGEGVLLKEIRNYLKNEPKVKEFRKGRYGEGENGVTIVKLK